MPSTRRGTRSSTTDKSAGCTTTTKFTVAPTSNSCDLRSARREGKKKDLMEHVTVHSVQTTGKTSASNKTKGHSCKKRRPTTSSKNSTKKKQKHLPGESAADELEEEDKGKKVSSVFSTAKEEEEMVKKVLSLFSTANSTTPTMSFLLTKSKSSVNVDVTQLNPNACINGEAFVGKFEATGESFVLADPQASPIIVCIRCGKISKSFDTFIKLHKIYYPQKHGPNSTLEKPQIIHYKLSKDPFIGNCQDYWYDTSEGDDGEWLASQGNVNADRTKWQKNNPECVELVKIDESSLDVCVFLPATKVAATHKKNNF